MPSYVETLDRTVLSPNGTRFGVHREDEPIKTETGDHRVREAATIPKRSRLVGLIIYTLVLHVTLQPKSFRGYATNNIVNALAVKSKPVSCAQQACSDTIQQNTTHNSRLTQTCKTQLTQKCKTPPRERSPSPSPSPSLPLSLSLSILPSTRGIRLQSFLVVFKHPFPHTDPSVVRLKHQTSNIKRQTSNIKHETGTYSICSPREPAESVTSTIELSCPTSSNAYTTIRYAPASYKVSPPKTRAPQLTTLSMDL